MRKWKIRTKMIAGLTLLAVVIGLLIFSSYSQLMRDRGLATEISQLAKELVFAHQLNELADAQLHSHSRFTPRSQLNAMIESDRLIGEEERQNEESGIHVRFVQLQTTLEDYRNAISEHSERHSVTSLLIDRQRQTARLNEIERFLRAAKSDWLRVSSLDHAVLSMDHRNDHLRAHLNDLVRESLAHFDEIQEGMLTFSDNVKSEQRAKRNIFYTYTTAAIFLITLLAWQFWSLIVIPFRTLFRGAQLIAEGHHKQKIKLGTDDEIGLMAETVNDITARFNRAVDDVTQAKLHAEQEVRDRTREVIQNEQLASTGFLAAGVAHEINNPLGIIAWTAESAEGSLEELDDDTRTLIDPEVWAELEKSLQDIQAEAFRCKGITERLLHFSRLGDSSRDQEDLGTLVESVVSMISKVGEYRCKKLKAHCSPGVIAHCNAQEIQQVVLNLISNALESVETDGHVNVYVENAVDPLSGITQATVIVQDDGCGMDQEVLDHLFEPFFTRRQSNTGTGLGLSISYRIVSMHHGSLTPHSNGAGCGSKMVLRLPTAPPAEEMDQANLVDPKADSLQNWKHVEKAA